MELLIFNKHIIKLLKLYNILLLFASYFCLHPTFVCLLQSHPLDSLFLYKFADS